MTTNHETSQTIIAKLQSAFIGLYSDMRSTKDLLEEETLCGPFPNQMDFDQLVVYKNGSLCADYEKAEVCDHDAASYTQREVFEFWMEHDCAEAYSNRYGSTQVDNAIQLMRMDIQAKNMVVYEEQLEMFAEKTLECFEDFVYRQARKLGDLIDSIGIDDHEEAIKYFAHKAFIELTMDTYDQTEALDLATNWMIYNTHYSTKEKIKLCMLIEPKQPATTQKRL